ncbi:DUF4124 domain-containing protein [Rhodoferax bucti]|uniref:DUF4124 domain-containing protein n=1 Tax=Rhodoferax bucti TaxID=2576305 RepID=UPI001109D846|nr:DUF4124 domain-containing protein [Rhodoferax bucti]
MKLLNTVIATLLLTLAMGASAQWQWIDKDGRKIFSDRGPGSEVPEKNILKRPAGSKPGNAAASPITPEATDPTASTGAPAPAPKDTGVDKSLEAKKKQAEAAEAAKKKAEDDRIARAKTDNCRIAKQAKATFDSGVRVARTNAAGEREYLDDATRAAEMQRIQGVIEADCR